MLRDLQATSVFWISGDLHVGTWCLLRALESCSCSSGGEHGSSISKTKRVPEVRVWELSQLEDGKDLVIAPGVAPAALTFLSCGAGYLKHAEPVGMMIITTRAQTHTHHTQTHAHTYTHTHIHTDTDIHGNTKAQA